MKPEQCATYVHEGKKLLIKDVRKIGPHDYYPEKWTSFVTGLFPVAISNVVWLNGVDFAGDAICDLPCENRHDAYVLARKYLTEGKCAVFVNHQKKFYIKNVDKISKHNYDPKVFISFCVGIP